MRKLIILAVVIIAIAGFFAFNRMTGAPADAKSGAQAGPGGAPRAGGPGGAARGGGGFGGGGAFARPPMTVELAPTERAEIAEQLMVVGNLIGEATVAVVPKVGGRLEGVFVQLGDRVARGARIAKVEDEEIREQVKQAEASFEVSRATIRQREADLKFAETNLERARNLFGRELLPRQSLDDADARYQAATAQLDLARAQFNQSQSRLDELRINLANTTIVSPVDGFIGKRFLDPGAFVSSNAPVVSVVDVRVVRLVTNLVERDLRRVNVGDQAIAEVDAFPNETFTGRVARVAPVLDPATRTAEMEIELPNPGFQLKPGMYARVNLTVERRPNALTVPRNALIDLQGQRGVFVPEGETARFIKVETGLQDQNRVEITSGIDEGVRVITTGAAGLQDGDRILLAGAQGGQGRPGGRPGSPGAEGRRPGSGAPATGGGAPRTGAPDRQPSTGTGSSGRPSGGEGLRPGGEPRQTPGRVTPEGQGRPPGPRPQRPVAS